MADKRQIGSVCAFLLNTLEQKNVVNTDVFCASEAQNHGIYDVFCICNTIDGIYNVLWPVPSKNTGIYICSFHDRESRIENPESKMKNRRWRTENRGSKIGNGESRVANPELKMTN